VTGLFLGERAKEAPWTRSDKERLAVFDLLGGIRIYFQHFTRDSAIVLTACCWPYPSEAEGHRFESPRVRKD